MNFGNKSTVNDIEYDVGEEKAVLPQADQIPPVSAVEADIYRKIAKVETDVFDEMLKESKMCNQLIMNLSEEVMDLVAEQRKSTNGFKLTNGLMWILVAMSILMFFFEIAKK